MLSIKIRQILENNFPGLEVNVTVPELDNHGHFTTNLAFAMAKKEGMPPIKAAEKIREKIIATDPEELFEKVEVVQPGFINFWLASSAIQKEFAAIAKQGGKWGKPNPTSLKLRRARKVIVEYSSPNIAKPMHVGHFRSTIIGDALANIYAFLGFKVIRWNYLGDWGVQFGKLMYAYKTWGNAKELAKEPIKTLLALYIKFHEESKINPELEGVGQAEFKKLEDGDRQNKKLWAFFRKASLKDFNNVYKVLGVKFDISLGESFYENDLKPLIAELVKNNLAVRSEGALIIDFDKVDPVRGHEGTQRASVSNGVDLPPALIEKSDGASLYFTREIANIKYRVQKYNPEKIIYAVGSEQSLHFQQLFKTAELLGLGTGKFFHVGNGLVLGPDGKKLSTREGKTIFIEDVIYETILLAREAVHKKNSKLHAKEKEKIAKAVAIGALKYNDLSQNRMSNITFDWQKMLNFEGDSAPYLQYTYARLRSILRKVRAGKSNMQALSSPVELGIIMKLDEFPEIINKSADTYYPHYLAQYLYELSKMMNGFYQEHPVLKAEKPVRDARLALIGAVSTTLKTGLNLLGIEALERM